MGLMEWLKRLYLKKEDKKYLPPSDEFMGAVCNAGSIVADCEFCGRTHFVDEHWGDFEEGEFENLMKKYEEDPDKYVFNNEYSSVSLGYLDGKQVVWGCPCNAGSRYEEFMWNHRYIFRDYIKAKAKKIAENAEMETGLAKDVNKAVNSLK